MASRQRFEERAARTQRRMSSGALGGRSEQAQPPPARPRAKPYQARKIVEIAPFGSNGDVGVAASGKYEVLVGGTSITAIGNLTAALSGATTILIKKNGTTVATLTIASGSLRGEVTAVSDTEPGDYISIESTAVGTGSALATVQVVME